MRNIEDSQKKSCIFLLSDEYTRLINTIFNGRVSVEYALDGISYTHENDNIDVTDEKVNDALSAYYDVKVTSVHADDCDYMGVWICYREEESYELSDNDKPEFIGRVIDILEDYCEEKGIELTNSDKEDRITELIATGLTREEAIETDGIAIIYGEDYDTISRPISDLIENDTWSKKTCYPEDKIEAALVSCIRILEGLVGNNFGDDLLVILDKLMNMCREWDIVGNLYYATVRIDTRTDIMVKANDIESAEEKGNSLAEDISIGELGECVACYVNKIEDENGNILWDKA